MKALGKIPENLSMVDVLDNLGENILLADTSFRICWINKEAAALLGSVVSWFGLSDPKELIGLSMDYFHSNPDHQRGIMQQITESRRSRITIKEKIVTDIIVAPVKNDQDHVQGYIVMLTDVTTKAEEELKKEKLIQELSVPISHIWEKTISLPLIGEFDQERADQMIVSVLNECAKHRIEYVLLDLSGLYIESGSEDIHHHLQKLIDCLRLIGAECIAAGIPAKIALSFVHHPASIQTFQTVHAGLRFIIAHLNK